MSGVRRVVALSAVLGFLYASIAGAAPEPVFNGDTFTRSAGAPSTGTADGVALQSGTFSYSVPIEVPPGRLGMQPSLALTYRVRGRGN